MANHEISVVSKVEEILRTCPRNLDKYQFLLTELNPIVQKSSVDEHYRQTLTSSKELWRVLKASLECYDEELIMLTDDEEVAFWYLRSVRGLLLLMRNMSVCNQLIYQDMQLENVVLQTFLKINARSERYDEITTSLYVIITGFLFNISKDASTFDNWSMDSLLAFLKYPMHHPNKSYDLLHAHAMFFSNLTASDDFLYSFFRHPMCDELFYGIFVNEIVQQHTGLFKYLDKTCILNEDYEITSMDAVLLKCFSNIATNESFAQYFTTAEKTDTDRFLKVLKLMQLVVTSSENWNIRELTNIMTWCFPIFQNCALNTGEYFETKQENEQEAQLLHNKLIILLDILSTLVQFEHVQKYILSYNGLERLLTLLQVLQDNLVRINFHKSANGSVKNLKTTNSLGEKITDQKLLNQRVDSGSYRIKPTNFPGCKSFLIEILTMLVYKNRIIQDKIRELHGLGLILSNCVIDDNDPFMRERSIVCIKFLLQDNKPNQDFVASLEAKKAVQDDVLSDAGYEVKISDSGNVGLVSKDLAQERH